MREIVESDIAAVGRTAARLVAQVILAAPQAVLALPTGRTPIGLYRELIRLHHDEGLDFSGTRIFNLDEFIGVPPGDERSFHHYLWQHFIAHVNVMPENVCLLPFTADEKDCRAYEIRIQQAGGIDLLIAGVGTNGHIAFNEPGSALDSRTRIVALTESTRNNMLAVFDPKELPTHAVTMGIGTILESRQLLVLASGPGKRKALDGVLQGPVTSENPVSAVRLHGNAIVIMDRDALEFGVSDA